MDLRGAVKAAPALRGPCGGMVDANDSKSFVARRARSSRARGTSAWWNWRTRGIRNPVPQGVWVRFLPPAPSMLAGSNKPTAQGARACVSGSLGGRTIPRSAPRNDNRTALSCWPWESRMGFGHRRKTTPGSDRWMLAQPWPGNRRRIPRSSASVGSTDPWKLASTRRVDSRSLRGTAATHLRAKLSVRIIGVGRGCGRDSGLHHCDRSLRLRPRH